MVQIHLNDWREFRTLSVIPVGIIDSSSSTSFLLFDGNKRVDLQIIDSLGSCLYNVNFKLACLYNFKCTLSSPVKTPAIFVTLLLFAGFCAVGELPSLDLPFLRLT